MIRERYIIGWDDWNYIISRLLAVMLVGAALLLDLMILLIKRIVKRIRKRLSEEQNT